MSPPVTVCIATFRRPSLMATLRSLARQTLPPAHVVIADNDDTDAAREAITAAGRDLGLALAYVHAPARNISVARNAALVAAATDWVAVIDDDEEATAGWLAALVAAAERTNADVVLGPVEPLYGDGAPRWIRDGAFHATEPVVVGGRIRTGYTSNVLFDRTAAGLRGLRFRTELGNSGGEDTDFFARAARAGAVIVAAPEAVVTEVVDPARARLSWLARRKFRAGQTHALLLADEGFRGVGPAAAAAGKCAVCVAAALATLPSRRRSGFWFLRGALHAGAVAGLLGARALTLYGKDRPGVA